jgi:DNA-binding response OmpR family regulator
LAHILIIDDEPAVRDMLRDALEPEHTVMEAANGIEGMRAFEAAVFDLVITDIIMPDQEGIQTILDIRRVKPGQKIIAMSGGGRTKTMEFLKLAEEIGVNRTLKKPFGPGVLRDAVRSCLRG